MSGPIEYLLGELEPSQMAEFERSLESDPALRAEVERLRPLVTRLEHAPAEVWDAPTPPPLTVPVQERAPRRLVLRPLVAAVCALALLVAGAGVGAWLDREPQPAGRLVLAPVGGLDPDATGTVKVGSDRVTVRVSGLRPTSGGAFYELWLLGPGQRLVGLGSFRVDAKGATTLTLPVPVDPADFASFDLSLEPGDGDPGHSGVSVLRGPSAS